MLLISALVSLHYSYVSYFHHQIIPFHFIYFGDAQFISANIGTAFELVSIIHFLIIVIISLFFLNASVGTAKSNPKYFAFFFTVALLAHVANIRYKIQWFVPQKLQVNAVEQLYFSFAKRSNPYPLNRMEISQLAKKMGKTVVFDKAQESTMLNKLLLHDSSTAGKSASFDLIKNKYNAAQNKQIIIVLMESQRPSESSLYQNTENTLTPALDKLGRSGFYFTNAYSTGLVTRTAQEAVLCGTRSGQETSFMRGRSDAFFPCLPLQVKKLKLPYHFNWIHGGEPKFDSQVQFWRNQQMDKLVSSVEMPANEFATGWGASDVTLFEYAAAFLADNDKDGSTNISTILTVTNHIPWDLPKDIEIASKSTQPSYLTTNYSDTALNMFVENLKASKIWETALLIVVSDHGNLEPPYNDLYANKTNKNRYSLSHVNLIISGGIAESVRTENPQIAAKIGRYVSQADIASTIANLNDIPFKTMGGNLFYKERLSPVYTDMGDGIFIPALDHFVPRDALLSKVPLETFEAIYHKAYLRLINFWK